MTITEWMRRWQLSAAFTFLAASVASGQLVILDFEDGTDNAEIGSFYATGGVTFAKANWKKLYDTPFPDPVPGVSGIFDIRHLVNDTLPKSDDPIVGTFSGPQAMVSITAIDVGANGARMDAYDAVVRGNLVGSDEFIGTGNGDDQWVVLKVLGPAIRRFELYQPRSDLGIEDGVEWDDLVFGAASICDRFTTTDFGPPMGKKKKVGSNLPIRFRLFFNGVEVLGQDALNAILEQNGYPPACPRISIINVSETSSVGDLPDAQADIEGNTSDAQEGDCFRFIDGNWVFKLRLDKTAFEAGKTYQVQVHVGDCTLKPGNNLFQTKQ